VTASDDLVALVAPPPRFPAILDWEAVEDRLGVRLPSDYKWLVERYGPGSFDDFLHIFQPGSDLESIRLEYQAERTAWALDYLRNGGESVPYENSELLSFGRTDNGDTCYWVRRPVDDPEAWTIVVNEARGPHWSTFEHGVVQFVFDVLSGNHHVSVFPDDFPSWEPEFAPYGA
jgi:SMI1/KNR4 family protein SUKH-1